MKRKLLTFSASQIKQFDRCPAFWAFNRVMGLPDVQTDKARRGVEIHREMELYAKLGQWPESKAGKKLVALYVCPAPGVAEVEVPVRYALPGGTEWVGYIDAVAEAGVGSGYRELSGDAGATVVLIDWKTTSDLKYALTPDQLLADTAANIYAHEAFAGGAGTVVLRWVYVKANGEGKPRVVEAVVDRADNAAFMAELDTLGWFLQQLYDMNIDPHLLTKDSDNCFKYGAMCPYREPCAPPSSGANDYTVEEITVTNDEFLTKIAPALPKRPAPPLPPKAALQKALDAGAKSPLVGDGVGVLDRVLTRLSETPRDTKTLLEAAVAPEKAGWRDIEPTVEAGFINSPEGASVPLAATPEEAAAHQGRDKPPAPTDELDALDKQALFVLAVKEGCFQPTDKVKLREQGLRRVIREARTKRVVLGEPAVPDTTDVPVVAERLTEEDCVYVESTVNAVYDALNRVGPTELTLPPEGSTLEDDQAAQAPDPDVDEQIAALDTIAAARSQGPQSEIVGLLHRIATALETLAANK